MVRAMRLSDRIGRRIKLQDLHILMTVVQAGSMGKAARQLNTSQPNISNQSPISSTHSAFGCLIVTVKGSSLPNLATRCSVEAPPYSTNCAKR